MNAGKTIRAWRVERGITQQQMAARLKVSRNAYMAWENNQTEITVNRLEALCEVLEISLRDFFEVEVGGPVPDATTVSQYNVVKLKNIIRERLYFLQEQNRQMVRLNRKLVRIMDRAVNSGKFPNLQGPIPTADENQPDTADFLPDLHPRRGAVHTLRAK